VTKGGAVRVGLVGCGRIARVHLGYLRALPQVELVGVCDASETALRAFVDGSDLRGFASLGALLEQGRPDVVHVLTPPGSHARLATQLLQAGVNVLVEKPLAMTAAEADAVIDAAARHQRWVTVDHNRYFDPVVQRAARLVAAGRLGRLVGVEVFQGAEAGEADKMAAGSDDWRVQLPGGILHNLASHPLYLMRRFAGPAAALRVVSRSLKAGLLEEVHLVVDGEVCPASVTMSMRAQPFMNRISLYGTAASVEVNLNNMTLIERRPRKLPKLVGKVWPNLDEARQLLAATVTNGLAFVTGKQRYYPGIGAHLAQLYASAAAGGEPPVSAAEGRDVVAWYDQILADAGVDVVAAAKAG
jgi:predicted dehydrogenase